MLRTKTVLYYESIAARTKDGNSQLLQSDTWEMWPGHYCVWLQAIRPAQDSTDHAYNPHPLVH